MADISAPSRISWRCRAFVAFVLLLSIAWMIDHRGCVRLARPQGEFAQSSAYIHRVGAGYALCWNERGNCGRVTYTRAANASDDRLFNTSAWEWRWLAVTLDGRQLERREVHAWRSAAADVFFSPSIVRGDVDESRRSLMGYPLEYLSLLVQCLLVFAIPMCAVCLPVLLMVAIARGVEKATDPMRKRRLLLQKSICPICRYSLHGLPTNRCPECGEGWSDWELLDPDAVDLTPPLSTEIGADRKKRTSPAASH